MTLVVLVLDESPIETLDLVELASSDLRFDFLSLFDMPVWKVFGNSWLSEHPKKD